MPATSIKDRVEAGKLALIRQLMDAKLKRSAARRAPKDEPKPEEAEATEEKKSEDELADDDAAALREMYESLK